MYVHLLHDRKFTPRIMDLFSILPEKSVYLHLASQDVASEPGVLNCHPDQAAEFIISNIQEVRGVFVHFLNAGKAEVISELPASVKVVWFFWGGDGFDLPRFRDRFLLPKTRRLQFKLYFQEGLVFGLRKVVMHLMGSRMENYSPYKEVIAALDKIHLVVPVVEDDYYLLKEKYRVPDVYCQVPYTNYLSAKELDLLPKVGEHVLLGNSADIRNNHLEAIDMLARKTWAGQQVIAPLSYGDPLYAKHIAAYGKAKLGPRFVPVRRFMEFDRYQNLIGSCGIVVMNHLRQQAMGNIIMALWGGAKVFLNEDSVLYRYFTRNEVHVFSIQRDLAKGPREHALSGLSVEQIQINKRFLYDNFSITARNRKLYKMIELLDSLPVNVT